MRYTLRALAVVLVCLVSLSIRPSGVHGKQPAEREKASVWMKKKLEFSQNILAGLTEGDFDKVSRNAHAMNFLGFLEKWARGNRPDYKRQLSYFEFANLELIRQAREQNLDGATLAYNQLAISCVQCHKIVRDTKDR